MFDKRIDRKLMDHMPNGLAYCRMIFRAGQVCDFTYLYTNPAFETLSGAKQVVGKKATEVDPPIFQSDRDLLEIFGRVANGAPAECLETFVESLGQWFSISVSSPRSEHFLVIFEVITRRKQAEQSLALAYERLALSQRAAMAGTWEWDFDSGRLYWSPELFRLFGLDSDQEATAFDTWRDLLHPEDKLRAEAQFHQTIFAHTPLESEYRIIMPTGGTRWIRACGDSICGERASSRRILGLCLDISARKIRETILRESGERYRALAENSHDWVWVIDLSGRLTYSNRRGAEILGYTEADISTHGSRDLIHPDDVSCFEATIEQALADKRGWTNVEWRWRHSSGDYRVLESTAAPLFDGKGELCGFQGIDRDITARKQAEIQIWQEANFDHLTGLPNRRLMYDRLHQEIRKSRRAGHALALLFLDLDHFKDINDRLGHGHGDILLSKVVAQRLTDCVRSADTVARLGGDEFTIILGELENAEVVERVARHLLRVFAEPFTVQEEQVRVTVSIGISLFPNDAVDAEQLLKNADQAMYNAKQSGRHAYRYFTPALQLAMQERTSLAAEMRTALDSGQFILNYQPIVELASGTLRKAEASIRWQHPVLGIIGPAKFIPIAEETGLIGDIGDWVFHTAVKQISQWRSRYGDRFQVIIRKSSLQFRNREHGHRAWFDYLQQWGLPGRNLIVEIDEAALSDISGPRTQRLLAFRDAGIQVAVDDFGHGYSDLHVLKKLHVDYLRIERSCVGGLTSDPEERALCEAIILMAHRLELEVIAEGVETPEQRDILLEAGCDYGQGYLFARPMPADEFENLLKTANWAAPARHVRQQSLSPGQDKGPS